LALELPNYSWAAFYMLDPEDPETLVLGICGAAVAIGETVIVNDVNSDPRHLSCSIKPKSEIVVSIYARGKVIGEIDIDSHDPAAFTDGK
jgi:L-methionine (R)-S-oxide reductase